MVVAVIATLIGWSLSGTTAYFRTPSELASQKVSTTDNVRVAGKVVDGSVEKEGATTTFQITDGQSALNVTTQAVLPDMFGPGVEVVAEGGLSQAGVFSASNVIAKCPSKFKAKQGG